ncbi:MAG: CBS domain-containing protein [Geminocystis sp.]|nr:CBS domain-containing protein [Geminocystis sp.]HIK36870.1 CBS domain-containing protein [Geminocystis sp. M7585_C2015_104]MCS7148514.1 CBS domain-containing protein [Geminocystis sp.]MCX8079470.1 CBS domain-containing protein [Geminocystis sp.]MDW8114913.1 CBS domain-containing protein [Geminocystis sp.]
MSKTVAQVMTPSPITVTPETPLQEAIALLVKHKISGMPVVNAKGEVVGVISESDLMWRETGVEPPPYIMILDSIIYLQNPARYEQLLKKALGQTVADVMTPNPITVTSNQSVKEAARILHQKNIRRLPVVDENNRVVGIITRGDIVRCLAESE